VPLCHSLRLVASVGALLLGCALSACADPRPAALALRETAPRAISAPLANPGMGIYLSGTLDPDSVPPDAWFADIVSIGYFRDDWSRLQPDGPGTAHFDEYFGPIFDLWVNRWGKRVAFRFMSSNMHSRQRYATPEWVFDRGVPSVVHRGLYMDEQVDPVFWDEPYLEIQEQFIADLGRYLDGRPGLEFIDIGSIGEWGEMHLSRWTGEELAETGFTESRYVAAYRRIIDAFARAFPRTRVFLNVGDYAAVNDYAALRGLHFRQDGLTPFGPSADVGKRFYHSYSRRGVICNYELHSSYEEMRQKGWGVRETLEKGLEDPISYLHINLMWYPELLQAPEEVKEAVTDAAARIGFRFHLTRLRCNEVARTRPGRAGRLVLEQTWRNAGVAPCYDSYALWWGLVDARGKVAAESIAFPEQPTTLWWPGEDVVLKGMLAVPGGTPPGVYRLKVAMVKPEEPGLHIELSMEGRDSEGRYDLGGVRVEPAPAGREVAYREGFEGGLAGWVAMQGMSVRTGPAAKSGRSCLLVTGRQPGAAWNYAALGSPLPIAPYSRYQLSCWMKVDSIDSLNPPYLKVAFHDADGKWLTNFSTNQYDLARMGSWQHLVGYAEASPEAAVAYFAVEKGGLENAVAASICLDDVVLELLESP